MAKLLKRFVLALIALFVLFLALLAGSYLVFVRPYHLHDLHIDGAEIRAAPGNYRQAITHDGRKRYYILHVPPGDVTAPMPVVIALHGSGGQAETTEALMGLTPIADREHFLVAFPNGVGGKWNDRSPGRLAAGKGIDDVGFIEAVIDDIASRLPIDSKRVYVTGISNGGFMSTRLACQAADRIAAVGVVDATAHTGIEQTCRPSRPVPLISFNGTADPLVPFSGGTVHLLFFKRGGVVSAQEYQSFWVQYDGCPPEANTAAVPDIEKGDGSHVIETSYPPCSSGASLDFYTIVGGGHTWPGGKQYLSRRLVGRTNRDINASEEIWRFFAAHPMP